MKNPSSGSRIVPCGQTDGRTNMMKLVVALRNFTNAPKKLSVNGMAASGAAVCWFVCVCVCIYIYIYVYIYIYIHEGIKSRLKLGNVCYYSVQNLLSSSLLSKNLKIKIYRTIILTVVLYGCETWSLTLREKRRLRVFENRVLRRVFGPKRDKVTGD